MNQLSQLLILYLTTPSSDFYIPKIIANTKDPTLEPYRLKQVSIGSVDVLGQSIGITLLQVDIRGISNVQIARSNGQPRIDVDGDTVTFHAVRPNREAPPANIPAELTIDAQLQLTVAGEKSPTIPITCIVRDATITGVFLATGDPAQAQTVNISFSSATVASPANADNIRFDLSRLESFLKPQIESYLKAERTLTDLINRVNGELAKPEILKAVSKSATDAVRSALGNLLSGG
jgi:hypothetical protein